MSPVSTTRAGGSGPPSVRGGTPCRASSVESSGSGSGSAGASSGSGSGSGSGGGALGGGGGGGGASTAGGSFGGGSGSGNGGVGFGGGVAGGVGGGVGGGSSGGVGGGGGGVAATFTRPVLAEGEVEPGSLLPEGDDDMLLEIFEKLGCTMALQRSACTCRLWATLLRRGARAPAAAIWAGAWLTVPMFDADGFVTLTAADALRRAPPGERVRLRAGTTITEEVQCTCRSRSSPGLAL